MTPLAVEKLDCFEKKRIGGMCLILNNHHLILKLTPELVTKLLYFVYHFCSKNTYVESFNCSQLARLAWMLNSLHAFYKDISIPGVFYVYYNCLYLEVRILLFSTMTY